jgi:heptosyltransferase-1
MSEPTNILLIKLSSLGDVLHAVPALWAIRSRFPHARITWLVDARYESILRGHAALDDLITATSPAFTDRLPFEHIVRAACQYAVTRKLRDRQFDLVVDLQGLFRSGLIAAATGCPVRVGFAYAREGAQIFYTRLVEGSLSRHAVRRYLDVAQSLGAADEPIRFEIPRDPEATAVAERMCREAGIDPQRPYALIAPESSSRSKNWTAAGFAAVSNALWARWRLPTVLTGAAKNLTTCESIAERSEGPAAILTGQPLSITTAMIAHSRLVIANDSGLLHLAVALGRPLVGVFGPTDPAHTGPWNRTSFVARCIQGCPRCHARSHLRRLRRFVTPHNCLTNLPAESVMAKVESALDATTSASSVT